MAKPPYAPDSIGTYRRRYDDVVESIEDDQASLELVNVLQWIKEPVDEQNEENETKNKLKAFLEDHVDVDELGLSAELKALNKKSASVGKILKDIYYAGRDIFSSNRTKTSVAIIGGIATGVAIGAVLGTLVLPVIGTALEGAIGAAISSVVAALGGTVGLTVIGGLAGSWFGKKLGDKAFKHEKHYEISKRITKKIKNQTGISSKVTQMINGYLYNRAKAVNSPICKKYYKNLRALGVLNASPTAMEKIARFFCHELKLLEEELSVKKSPEISRDLEAVVYILRSLHAAQGISLNSKMRIEKAFQQYREKQNKLPKLKLNQGIQYDEKEISPQVLAKSTKLFLNALPQGVENVEMKNKQSQNGAISYRYKLQTNDGKRLPDLTFKSKKGKQDHIVTKVTVKANEVTDANKKKVAKVIAAQAKAYSDSTQNREVVVLAAGDDDLAIQLIAAVMKQGLEPRLSEEEYPANDLEAQQRKKVIMDRVMQMHDETLESKKRKRLDN